MPDLSPELSGHLRRLIAKYELTAVADDIFANAAECFALTVAADEDYSSVGNTRFGGDPDLPPNVPWPSTGDPRDPKSRFSNFIAQINFAELPPLSSPSPLPPSGVLYLFVRYMECAAESVQLDAVYYP